MLSHLHCIGSQELVSSSTTQFRLVILWSGGEEGRGGYAFMTSVCNTNPPGRDRTRLYNLLPRQHHCRREIMSNRPAPNLPA